MPKKNQKPKEDRSTSIRVTHQARRKLNAFKAVHGCKTVSEAIEKLVETANKRVETQKDESK